MNIQLNTDIVYSIFFENIVILLNVAKGIPVTLEYSITSVLLGFILGGLIAVAKISKYRGLVLFADFYTSIFRGTPMLVQLSIVYFVIPVAFNIKLSVFVAGIISFSLNSAAYISEIIKSGIRSIDIGQFEAAKALGVSYYNMMKDIVLPQAIRCISPTLVNEFANMVKESSIIFTLGEMDIMRCAQSIALEKYTYFAPMISAAICYYVIVLTATYCEKIIAKKIK